MASAPAAPACKARAVCRRCARRRRVSPTLQEQGEARGKQGPVQGATAAKETTAEEKNQVLLTRIFFLREEAGGGRRGPGRTSPHRAITASRIGTKRCGSASVSPPIKRTSDVPWAPIPLDPILTTLGRCQESCRC